MLAGALAAQPLVSLEFFSWRIALLGRYDILHLHWPEIMIGGRLRLQRLFRRICLACLIARLWIWQIPVVRTLHNRQPHDQPTTIDRWLLRLLDQVVVGEVALNDLPSENTHDARAAKADREVVLLGHYRDWCDDTAAKAIEPTRTISYVGHIRRYKNVHDLVRAFVQLDRDISLVIAGQPESPSIVEDLHTVAAGDPRIHIIFGFVSDAELLKIVSSSRLVVFPAGDLFNSSTVLMALSLNRPVLVPAGPAALLLADEVGRDWVYTFDPPLSSFDLGKAFECAEQMAADLQPDLSRRGWDTVGRRHVELYQRVVARPRRSRWGTTHE